MASKGFNGEVIHFGAVRLRVTGSGNLQMSLNSLNDINVQGLQAIAMQKNTNIEPTKLSNMLEQRASLTVGVWNIDETFTISKITVFIRPTYTGWPQ